MRKLIDKEEVIMQIIWKLGKAFMKEIIEEIPKPKPPYNTLLSTIRKLEKDGFVGYKTFGKSNQYYPLIHKEQHQRSILSHLKNEYFAGSRSSLLSYFMKEEKLTEKEIKEILAEVKKNNK